MFPAHHKLLKRRKKSNMQLLNNRKGHELTEEDSFGESISYSVSRFDIDGSLALMTVYRDETGNMETEPVSVNLKAYGRRPMPGHTFVKTEYHESIKPLLTHGLARICRRIQYGPFDAAAFDMEILIDGIEEIADNNVEEYLNNL